MAGSPWKDEVKARIIVAFNDVNGFDSSFPVWWFGGVTTSITSSTFSIAVQSFPVVGNVNASSASLQVPLGRSTSNSTSDN